VRKGRAYQSGVFKPASLGSTSPTFLVPKKSSFCTNND
jgi:hypothetical protein